MINFSSPSLLQERMHHQTHYTYLLPIAPQAYPPLAKVQFTVQQSVAPVRNGDRALSAPGLPATPNSSHYYLGTPLHCLIERYRAACLENIKGLLNKFLYVNYYFEVKFHFPKRFPILGKFYIFRRRFVVFFNIILKIFSCFDLQNYVNYFHTINIYINHGKHWF